MIQNKIREGNKREMSDGTVFLDTELRKLRPAELYTLGQILNVSDSWKKLMAIVPKDDSSNLPKFNTEHFSMIEQAAQQQRRNAAEIFLSEWGTMGRTRATLHTLLNLLVKAELFRAADYVAGNILHVDLPKRPECGPAAPVDISDDVIRQLLEEKDELDNLGFNESLVFASPSNVNDNEAPNSNETENESNDSSLERNMQSTKLVSTKGKHDEKHVENLDEPSNAQISDLMKFSTELNLQRQQEMSSRDLPVFLNDFGRSAEQTKVNHEVLSDELPVFLNNTISTSNDTLATEPINISMRLSNLNINGNEMNSIELPQCIVDIGLNGASNDTNNKKNSMENNDNVGQNSLASQELPITVLEYNE